MPIVEPNGNGTFKKWVFNGSGYSEASATEQEFRDTRFRERANLSALISITQPE